MELFKKPKWLKPELNEPIYYAHIAIILAVVYGLMQVHDPSQYTGLIMFFVYGIYLIIGDGVAHTVLQMD